MIPKQKREDSITGKLLFSKTKDKPLEDGREIMLVYGKVAVPKNSGIKNGYLHPIAGLGRTLTKAPIISCFINSKVTEDIRIKLPERTFNELNPELWEF